MDLIDITISKLDPNCAIQTPTRSVEGVVKSRSVILDTDYDEYARWIYVGSTGSLSYVGWDGVTVSLTNIAAGIFHPIYSKRINSVGTSATGLLWGN